MITLNAAETAISSPLLISLETAAAISGVKPHAKEEMSAPR